MMSFKNLARSLATAFVAVACGAACGPITPSASKFAKGSSEATEVSHSSDKPALPSAASLKESILKDKDARSQRTVVESIATKISKKVRFDLGVVDLGEFMKKGITEFTTESLERANGIKDREATLVQGRVDIHLLVDAPAKVIEEMNQNIKAHLFYAAESSAAQEGGAWTLVLDEDTDEELMKLIQSHLRGITVTF